MAEEIWTKYDNRPAVVVSSHVDKETFDNTIEALNDNTNAKLNIINSYINDLAAKIYDLNPDTVNIDIHYMNAVQTVMNYDGTTVTTIKPENMPFIKRTTLGDWVDLYADADIEIPKGGFALIPLGISMKLPDGYEAHLAPRGSTFKKWGIIQTNSVGVVDNNYNGTDDQWYFPAYCAEERGWFVHHRDDSKLFTRLTKSRFGRWLLKTFDHYNYYNHYGTIIKKGDRIAQFRIIRSQPVCMNFNVVAELNDTNRGAFGSTGSR